MTDTIAVPEDFYISPSEAARLLKLSVEYQHVHKPLGEVSASEQLANLQPEEVFAQKYQQARGRPAPEEILAAFHELMDRVQQAD